MGPVELAQHIRVQVLGGAARSRVRQACDRITEISETADLEFLLEEMRVEFTDAAGAIRRAVSNA